jgi:mycofactocin system transcriptional regulator
MRKGRPPVTSRDKVARVALELFALRGFETTTVSDIAAAAGTSRRTVFRYFRSKNDMVWGDFDSVLDRLRADLATSIPDDDLLTAVGRAVVLSNRYPASQLHELRVRIRLITQVPALQAHSMLRYAEWRQVVAEFTATRLGLAPDALTPQALSYAALGTAIAAFSHWAQNPGADLERNLERGFELLASGYDSK